MATTIRVPSLRYFKPRRQWCVDLPLADGRRHRLYLNAADDATARDRHQYVIAEWLKTGRRFLPAVPWSTAAARTAAPGEPMFIGLARVAADFVRLCRRKYRTAPGHFRDDHNVTLTMRQLRDHFRHRHARSFVARDLEAFQQAMVNAGLSISTIRRRMRYVRLALYEAAKNGHVPTGIVHAVQLAERVRVNQPGVKGPTPRQPVDVDTVDCTLPHLIPTVAAMVRTLLLTGMRRSELFNMRAIDLDTSGTVWTYTPARHKTHHRGKGRRVLIDPQAQELIRPRLSGRRVDQPVFSPADSEREAREA